MHRLIKAAGTAGDRPNCVAVDVVGDAVCIPIQTVGVVYIWVEVAELFDIISGVGGAVLVKAVVVVLGGRPLGFQDVDLSRLALEPKCRKKFCVCKLCPHFKVTVLHHLYASQKRRGHIHETAIARDVFRFFPFLVNGFEVEDVFGRVNSSVSFLEE